MEKQKQTVGRKPYEAPRLDVIDLAADEVLVVGCKTGIAISSQNGTMCVNPASCSGDNAS